jgi:nucleoside-diphosphate-sugar epimerase
MTIAILGSNGFVGNNIVNYLDKAYKIIGLNRENYSRHKRIYFEYFINANGNSKKYLAENDPIIDLEKNVESVYHTIQDFKIDTYIHISSIESNLNSIYGIHKRFSEEIVKKYYNNYYILRCSSIIGKDMTKGVLFDIINNKKVRLTKDSMLQFISINEICNFINFIIKEKPKQKEYNVTGINNISIEELEKITNKKIIYNDELKYEIFEYPSNNNVYKFKTSEEYVKEVIYGMV